MAKYSPIWEQIKDVGECYLAVHAKHLVARIVKAVTKLKYEDVAFKKRLCDSGRVATLEKHYDVADGVLKFWLVYKQTNIIEELL
jgi:hypothetical protein